MNLTHRQAAFLWLGRPDLFRRVYDPLTHKDFSLLEENPRLQVLKTVPEEYLNLVGFALQVYLTGLPEWLLVDLEIRMDIAKAYVPRMPYKHTQRYKNCSRVDALAWGCPTSMWDPGKKDFLYMWDTAIRSNVWKKLKPSIPRTPVMRTCKCGTRGKYEVCKICQREYLKEQLFVGIQGWKKYARKNRVSVKNKLLPYFFTADPKYLPEEPEFYNFYYSPLVYRSNVAETEVLRSAQDDIDRWVRNGDDVTIDRIMNLAYRQSVDYRAIAENPTSIPVRMYSLFRKTCIVCDKDIPELHNDLDEPAWYNSTVLCDSCDPAADHCAICGAPYSTLGVCLPCLSSATRRAILGKGFSHQKLEIISACTGTYRIKDQHYNITGGFQYYLRPVKHPKLKPCVRCERPVYKTVNGLCRSCQVHKWRKGKSDERKKMGKRRIKQPGCDCV